MHKVSQAWLYGSVKPYFDRKGIKLLRDDMLFIEKCLQNIAPERHKSAIKGYFSIYDSIIKNNNEIASMGVNARYEANSYLREVAGLKKTD